jgi:dimethylhistidine N-methyltransferase
MKNLIFHNYHPTLINFEKEVLKGLSLSQKKFPAQFFYHDQKGSDLFNQICQLEEYYLTRTEVQILEKNMAEIADFIGENSLLIEYGSGSVEKAYLLLDSLKSPYGYMPIDIAKIHLLDYIKVTAQRYPQLPIIGLVADYTNELEIPEEVKNADNPVIFFAGSTIGNLDYPEAIALLQKSAHLLQGKGGLLIGVDLKKDPHILHAAYNDQKGITAQFNLHVLENINQELDANFELSNFKHYAFYNPYYGRIEMHLFSTISQDIKVKNQIFHFQAGETIHTENSYKYSQEDFQQLAQKGGFEVQKIWTDSEELFALFYCTVK